MDENEKTIIVDGIELPVDTYFDAQEESWRRMNNGCVKAAEYV